MVGNTAKNKDLIKKSEEKKRLTKATKKEEEKAEEKKTRDGLFVSSVTQTDGIF